MLLLSCLFKCSKSFSPARLHSHSQISVSYLLDISVYWVTYYYLNLGANCNNTVRNNSMAMQNTKDVDLIESTCIFHLRMSLWKRTASLLTASLRAIRLQDYILLFWKGKLIFFPHHTCICCTSYLCLLIRGGFGQTVHARQGCLHISFNLTLGLC